MFETRESLRRKAYYQANRQHIIKKAKDWYQANREKVLDKMRMKNLAIKKSGMPNQYYWRNRQRILAQQKSRYYAKKGIMI